MSRGERLSIQRRRRHSVWGGPHVVDLVCAGRPAMPSWPVVARVIRRWRPARSAGARHPARLLHPQPARLRLAWHGLLRGGSESKTPAAPLPLALLLGRDQGWSVVVAASVPDRIAEVDVVLVGQGAGGTAGSATK
jgi:hypothetical protein